MPRHAPLPPNRLPASNYQQCNNCNNNKCYTHTHTHTHMTCSKSTSKFNCLQIIWQKSLELQNTEYANRLYIYYECSPRSLCLCVCVRVFVCICLCAHSSSAAALFGIQNMHHEVGETERERERARGRGIDSTHTDVHTHTASHSYRAAMLFAFLCFLVARRNGTLSILTMAYFTIVPNTWAQKAMSLPEARRHCSMAKKASRKAIVECPRL